MTRIAVVGGGAAGLGAARELQAEGAEVVLIEAAPRVGGNCLGLEVPGTDGRRHAIDVGVSDFNRVTFTEVGRLVDELDLETRPICNDAAFASIRGELRAAVRDGDWTFRAPAAAVDRLRQEIDGFRSRATEVLRDRRFAGWSLGRYLDHIGASEAFRRGFLYPRAAGSFPMPDVDPERFHARSLLRFWNIHGIVGEVGDRHVIAGGMHRWPAVFARRFVARGGELRLGTRVRSIERRSGRVRITTEDAAGARCTGAFDGLILALHPSQSAQLLADAAPPERRALEAFPRQRARVVVHTDPRLMADERDAWGAYNYVVPEPGRRVAGPSITFFPRRLARLPEAVGDVFVTMNPHREPDPDAVLAERSFLHPVGSRGTDRAIAGLAPHQGQRRTWFAHSGLRAPFVHESALTSGIAAARAALESVAVPTLVG